MRITMPFCAIASIAIYCGAHAAERPTGERSTISIVVSPRTQTIPQGGNVRFTAHISGVFDQFGLFQVLMNGVPCMGQGSINISAPPGTIEFDWLPNIQTPGGCAPGTYTVTFDSFIPGQGQSPGDAVTVIIAPPACQGDINADRVVDAADLSVLLSNFGNNVVAGTNGDLNSDGIVNGSDVSVLLARFGTAC